MYKEKIVNIESICKFLWSEIYAYLESKEQTVMWLAELLNKSQPYISDLLNWKRSTSNLEIYKKMALSLWMSVNEFDELLKKARKYEYEIATWEVLDEWSELLKNFIGIIFLKSFLYLLESIQHNPLISVTRCFLRD